MITALDIYVLNLVDSLISLFGILAVITFSLSIALLVGFLNNVFSFRALKISIIYLTVWILLSVFIPSKQTLIEMYAIPKILEIEGIKELPPNIIEFLNNSLTENKKDNDKESI